MEENKPEYNRYNNSKVYKLINTVDDTFYIGSTTTQLSKRLSWHKRTCLYKQSKARLYEHMSKIGMENFKIILINEFYLNNNEELRREENNYIEMYKNDSNCLNMVRAYASDEVKKEQMIKSSEKFRKEHREEILKRKIEYYIKHKYDEYSKVDQCICGSSYTHSHRLRHERTKKHQAFMHDQKAEAETI